MVVLLNKYELGDMTCCYYMEEETKNVELVLLPKGIEPFEWNCKKQNIDSLIQLKIVGDIYPGAYAGGNTMRQGMTCEKVTYISQTKREESKKTVIATEFTYQNCAKVIHYIEYIENKKHIETYVTFRNEGEETLSLEMISSFSLGGITPYIIGEADNTLRIHRLRSVWSMEGRLESKTVEELQLEPSWSKHAVRSERFGQVGSMPVNHYFPYLVVEDSKNDIFWGAQLKHNASWQMEIYRKDEGLSISGGLADREFGHWMKNVANKEQFVTPKAIISVCVGGGVDRISQRMTAALEESIDAGPESEQDLPIVFNEFCTTWGCPSHDNIEQILNCIKNKGFSYFVIDCGWYKEEGIAWDRIMGDYNISKVLFPEGLQKTVKAIRDSGMKPGIWFEIENVGDAAKAYQKEDHLLTRDGKVLTTTMRRFWDMRDPWVIEYLTTKVIQTLQGYGFEYMKIDYNDTIGLGCDGAESLGEGLRQTMQASYEFIEKVKKEVPGIILENCASGGHRLEPLMMELMSMASFSDAHECEEIPVIAANLHRAILPRQSQIWAVIRKEDSLKRIAYSIINTFLGRMCISGDVTQLEEKQWNVIDKGIAFYKKVTPIIKNGQTYRFGPEIMSYRNLSGWQGVLRVSESGKAFAIFHVFKEEVGTELEMVIPKRMSAEVLEYYSDSEFSVEIRDYKIVYKVVENKKAVAVLLDLK